jgi:NDP-sugar pyrophosphorylase family protein
MKVLIIAGGLGTRLGQLTPNQPKSLVQILSRPFIEYQFYFLRNSSVINVVLCLGYQGQQIADCGGDRRKFGINLKYSFENKPLDVAGAIRLAEPILQQYFFMLYGDSYVSLNFKDMIASMREKQSLRAMAAYQNHDSFDKSNTAVADGYVTYYSKEKRGNLKYIDYGVNLFRQEVLKLIPEAKPYSMGALFSQFIERGELLAHEVKKRFYEIGSVNGLTEFTEDVRGRI